MIVIILFPKVHQHSIFGYTEWTNTHQHVLEDRFLSSCLRCFLMFKRLLCIYMLWKSKLVWTKPSLTLLHFIFSIHSFS